MASPEHRATSKNCMAVWLNVAPLPRHLLAAMCILLFLPQCVAISDKQRRYEVDGTGTQRSVMRKEGDGPIKKEAMPAEPEQPEDANSDIAQYGAEQKASYVSGAHGEEDLELVIPQIGSIPSKPYASHREGRTAYRLRGVTNPSFVVRAGQDQIWLAARKIVVGPDPEDPDSDWINEVLLGSVALSDFRMPKLDSPNSKFKMAWKRFGSAVDIRVHGPARQQMEECEVHKNRFGPEDPRLFEHAGKIYLVVVGTDVIDPRSGRIHDNDLLRPKCKMPREGVRLHLAEVKSMNPVTFGPTTRLSFKNGLMQPIERAWSMFSYLPQGKGKNAELYGIYSVHPHTIMSVDPWSGECKRVFSENSTLVEDLADKLNVKPSEFRGGSGVARVFGFQRKPYLLAVMHISWFTGEKNAKPLDKAKHYAHFAYKFSPQPPFNILQISSVQLPLSSREFKTTADSAGSSRHTYFQGVNYVSSILYDDSHVVIGYGEADKTSRIYRQNIDDFESQFFGS
mmetsp:Transcript_80710/g.140077  ORF Transcript_80710/g.140077 Transcript_80710/m.140077 type:complete len:510 (-) Transcript_80710:93-1622(-)